MRYPISFLKYSCVIAFAFLFFLSGSAEARSFGRILEDVDLVETPAHYDLTISFSCPVRYVAHTPASQGNELRVRLSLGNGCPTTIGGSNESLVTPAPAVVRTIELMSLFSNEAELLIHWRLEQKYVLIPTNDQRGVRIRILREGETGQAQAKVFVGEVALRDTAVAYAINLESSRLAFSEVDVQKAKGTLGGSVYISEQEINGAHWYRLRYGPIATRAEAERLVLVAQKTYPRAWLAIADEQITEQSLIAPDETLVVAPAEKQVANNVEATKTDGDVDALWNEANARFRRKEYSVAIELFTKLIADPRSQHKAAAQELIGLAHERLGELAHAQAEYEQFLRDFPKDKAADRVRQRLNALRTASLPGRQGSGPDDFEEGTWKYNGGISQYYRRDDNALTVNASSQRLPTLSGVLNDFDFTARYRGFETDTRFRVSAGYRYDLSKGGAGSQLYVSSAFVELSDGDRLWYGSLGRQNRSGSGSFGTYDGLVSSYQWHPHFTTDLTVGMPVDSSRSSVNSKRFFQSVAFNFGIFANVLEPSLYLVNQSLEGKVDRQAVGTQIRYFRPGRVFIGFADYDVHFSALNTAVLVGNMQLPASWSLNVDLEKRKNPLVTTHNALIGQPVSTLDALSSAFNDDRIKQLALDRTPDTQLYSLTASRPIGERFQLHLTAQRITTGASPPSDGSDVLEGFPQVEGIPPEGPEMIYSTQLVASGLLRSGDINIFGLRHQTGGSMTSTSFGLSSRMPIWGDWRVGPQLRVDRSSFENDDSKSWLFAPSLRLSLQKPTVLFDLEVGNELSTRDSSVSKQDSNRYYYYFGYRWQF